MFFLAPQCIQSIIKANIYRVRGTILRALYLITYFILTAALGGWHSYPPHRTGEETEVLRTDVPHQGHKARKGHARAPGSSAAPAAFGHHAMLSLCSLGAAETRASVAVSL